METLQAILRRLNITAWDLFIIGDGSGSGWNSACGWAGCLCDHQSHARRFFWGGMNLGSVNCAESMPYMQALTWFDAVYGKERLKARGHLNVHVLTDSQTIATWGNRAMSPEGTLPRSNIAIWAPMREYRRLGYHCQFYWAARSTTQLNWASDLIAALCRQEIQRAMDPRIGDGVLSIRAANAIAKVKFHGPDDQPINPYHLNPDEEHVNHADGHDPGTGHSDQPV